MLSGVSEQAAGLCATLRDFMWCRPTWIQNLQSESTCSCVWVNTHSDETSRTLGGNVLSPKHLDDSLTTLTESNSQFFLFFFFCFFVTEES